MAISYSMKGAGLETGVSESLVNQAVSEGLIEVRYWNSKKLIEHDELVRFIKSLPTEKPEQAGSHRAARLIEKKKPGVVAPGQSIITE